MPLVKPKCRFDQATIDRFGLYFTKGEQDECWNWFGGKDRDGYGLFRVLKQKLQTHRMSYEIHKGAIPDGLWVLHKCDNTSCVNPKHLFLGTRTDNVRDMVAKGRFVSGGLVLTEDDVRSLRQMYEDGKTKWELADIFKVKRCMVSQIINKKHWKNVT